MDWDLAKIIGVVVLLMVGLCWGVVVAVNLTYVGQQYDVVVIVQATEKSTKWGEHTNVWMLTYAGEDPLVYTFNGYHDVTIGETYRIVFINVFSHLSLGCIVRGNVISIELLT